MIFIFIQIVLPVLIFFLLPKFLVPRHTYPNGSSFSETAPEHSASLHRNYGYASDLSKHSGTISGKLSSRRFRCGEVLGANNRYWPILLAACLVFMASWYLPSPLVHGAQTKYITHFVGGGVFCGLLGLYIMLVKKWRWTMLQELAGLLALVSTLGVVNELAEAVLFWAGKMPQGVSDTTWDLVANTTGAIVFYLLYVAGREAARGYHRSR